jgi:hypothetical protein
MQHQWEHQYGSSVHGLTIKQRGGCTDVTCCNGVGSPSPEAWLPRTSEAPRFRVHGSTLSKENFKIMPQRQFLIENDEDNGKRCKRTGPNRGLNPGPLTIDRIQSILGKPEARIVPLDHRGMSMGGC